MRFIGDRFHNFYTMRYDEGVQVTMYPYHLVEMQTKKYDISNIPWIKNTYNDTDNAALNFHCMFENKLILNLQNNLFANNLQFKNRKI